MKLLILWMGIFLLVPRPASGQAAGDSVRLDYDSIQDARMDRMDWRTDRRFERIEGDQDLLGGSVDTMGIILDSFRHHLERLDVEKQSQSEKLLLLGEELEATRESSRIYQEKLKVTLWISGMIILVLLSASFLVLLLYGLKTRQLLDRFRWKQKQIRKDLSGQIETQEELFLRALSVQDQKLRAELRTQKSAVKKAARKMARKTSRKTVMEAIRKFKLKKRKGS